MASAADQSSTTTTSSTTRISASRARSFTVSLLSQFPIPPERAEMIAHALVLADLRGVDTHGINRLPGYIARLQSGALSPNPNLHFDQKTPVMASLDAQNTFGFVAATLATEHCVSMARTYGLGVVGVRNSGHYGMAATYLLQAMDQGFAAFAFTNASRSMPPWGAREPLLGTSPFAVGLPGGTKGGFVLDMSPAVVARGKVRKAARRGESIPQGWMLDAQGRNTTDANEALKGVVLPIGGPKGSGIALMMDVFGGLLTGSAFGGEVNDQYSVLDKPQGVGHWIMVFKPDVFLDSREEYEARMDTLLQRVRDCEKADGVERIWTPGEIEEEKQRVLTDEGIPFTNGEIEALHKLATEVGSDASLV